MRKRYIPATRTAETAVLEQDYAQARVIGTVCVGTHYVFHTGILQIRYMPLDEIVWAYLRREQTSASLGCRRVSIPVYYLMLVTGRGSRIQLAIGGREDGMAAIEYIANRMPDVVTGYSEANAAKFR